MGLAQRGELEELRVTLRDNDYTPRQVRNLARALLDGEIRRAKDREDREFVRSLRPCAIEVSSALIARSKKRDGVAAEATLLLLEIGRLSRNPKRYRDDEDGAFRAVYARATKSDHEARTQLFVDDDERVRRAALLAAIEAEDARDVGALLEVSRLDPDPLCRHRAYQALGAIGGANVTEALLDRFPRADTELKLAIVDAWSSPKLYPSGGKRQLQRLLMREEGLPSVVAASILARDSHTMVSTPALGRMTQFAETGTTDERRLALRLIPLSSDVATRALLKASKDAEDDIAVVASARLLSHASTRSEAEHRLKAWARDPESRVRFQARAALAAAGSESVLPWLTEQTQASEPPTREVAGTGLIRLGALANARPLLADEDVGVRRTIACAVLSRAPVPLD
jgi:HEAT repeat protein